MMRKLSSAAVSVLLMEYINDNGLVIRDFPDGMEIIGE